ncbi:DUF2783 domain-containing protein [Duganella callida]|uniref:DUF2783 domain-containing protein n=1 Tax=Duganella callida TaxID=2561932 RepID=A0A4Y9SRH2_9BURK|nr:DUF2783 domain-containing protein [Duganella callida]TFW29290.1 DUF2783 domain-containing protein [Duganella callida]
MITQLNLRQNLDDFEALYDMLSDSQEGLDTRQSEMFNAQLLLLLCNHIGDMKVLGEACALARVKIEIAQMPN